MAETILIVDDDPHIVTAIAYLMKRAGYEVAIANDGRQALDYLADNSPSLVILDVMIPGTNGFEVCEKIRAESRFAKMPVLMLSAKGRDAEMNKGLALGANAYITKPFSTYDLVERVKSLLRS